MRSISRVLFSVLLIGAWSFTVSVGFAQDSGDAPPATPPPTEDKTPPPADDAAQEEKKEGEAPPSLDDLLGLEESTDDNTTDAAQRAHEEELARRLSEREISDMFIDAVEQMSISADLLDGQFDPGLGTQRIQEDILRKLDTLIDQAKQQQQKSSSSSSSQQQQQQQQDPGKQRENQGEQDQQEQRNSNPNNSQEMDPPPGQDANPNAMLEEAGTEWGNLPDRIRDLMRQGERIAPSELYRRLTEQYWESLGKGGS